MPISLREFSVCKVDIRKCLEVRLQSMLTENTAQMFACVVLSYKFYSSPKYYIWRYKYILVIASEEFPQLEIRGIFTAKTTQVI